jgi:hypothetical protein
MCYKVAELKKKPSTEQLWRKYDATERACLTKLPVLLCPSSYFVQISQ